MPDKKPTKKKAIPLQNLRVLRLRPGDIVVVHIPFCVPLEQKKRMLNDLERTFDGRKTILLDGGATLSVIRKEQVHA